MIVNSAREYRTWFKEYENRHDVNENFMGCSFVSSNVKENGFFNLFHGKKDDIERFLPSLLDIAEDNQAIYEFLQNAVDCGATHFWAFYNDKYFLAVNNGSKFSLAGLSSILNIAQSTKDSASSIGRLGIGFKLAHRLVGKGNGTHELIYENKGPIMFSWDNASQLQSLMSSEEIHYDGLEDNSFLLKIAITNFPANVNESVKDVRHNDVVVFPESELIELRTYVKECLENLFTANIQDFYQGTLFFIKLGENKRKLLDADLTTLKNGIEYSMNTLKQLNYIRFNGETITKKDLVLCESSISKDTEKFQEIDPQYKEYDILYSFGYLPLDFNNRDYYKAVSQLRQSPNFYKYFPMGDEVDNMALFVHSDSFQVEANRRKLINHHTNRELLPEIASYIISTLNNYQSIDRDKYLQLYASVLLTDRPKSQEKSWMHPAFFDKLYAAIKSNVPTLLGTSNDLSKVKIKKLDIDIPLDKIGHSDKQWFAWNGDTNKELLAEAIKIEKLGVEEWNINSIIVYSDKNQLNAWLDTCNDDVFEAFINEIKKTTTSNEARAILPQVKLFKIGGERKSKNEIDADNNYVISTSKNNAIKPVLEKVGMKCTDVNIETHPLSNILSSQNEKALFANIKTAVENNAEKLTASDKLNLVTTLSTFEGISDGSIKQLKIFKNCNGDYCCLSKLTGYDSNAESWQKTYVICKEENYSEFQKYLVPDKDMFQSIIGAEYNEIFDGDTTIDEMYEFYQKKGQPWDSNLTINLIRKYGASEDVLSLIEKTSDKNSVEYFIRQITSLPLLTINDYANTSYEYRCIQLAAKVGATLIRNKITVDGIGLTEFASSDILSFKYNNGNKETEYCIKLSDVLPDDKQCAIYGKIVSKFSSIVNYTSIFSADSSNMGNVGSRLSKKLSPMGVLITPAQYAYILLTRGIHNWSLGGWLSCIRMSRDQISEIISYFYDNNLMTFLIMYKNDKPFSSFVKGKYLFSKKYTIESDRADKSIEDWCGTDLERKKALISLDMHFDDSAEISRRKAFANNTMSSWDAELTSTPYSFLEWLNSTKPFYGDNQKKLLLSLCQHKNVASNILKISYNEDVDYKNATELNTSKYNSWRKADGIKIFTVASEMPCRIIYNNDEDNVFCKINYGDYKYFDTKHLYIKGQDEKEIASSLTKVYSDNSVPFSYEDYISVIFNSLEEQRQKDEKIREYEELLKNYLKDSQLEQLKDEAFDKEEYINEYSTKIKEFMGGDFTMPLDKVKSEHIISRYRSLMYIKALNKYTLSPKFDEKSYIRTEGYAPIPLAEGKHINVQSAKFGIWHLSPVIWNDIVEKGNFAFLCTGNGESDFRLIENEDDIREIAESTRNVFMRLTPTKSMNIIDTIKSILSPSNIPEIIYTNRDVHLMLLVHPTKESVLNSMFDKVFNAEGDYNINELG